MTESTYTVTGMTCGHCVHAVTEEVTAVPGVEQVDLTLEDGTLVVRGEDVSPDAVRAAVEEAGYQVA